MKKILALTFLLSITFFLAIGVNAQSHWSGTVNTTSNIYRIGNIGIGSSYSGFPNYPLHVRTNNAIGLKLVNTSGGPSSSIGIDFCTYDHWVSWDQRVANISVIPHSSFDASMIFSTRQASGSGGNDVIERMRITNTGNVGIGITPSHKLHVSGRIACSDFRLTKGSLNSGNILSIDGNGDAYWTPFPGSSSWTANWQLNPDNSLSNLNSGNIGIGTLTPSYKLDVDGVGSFTGIKIGTTSTSGYVLTSDANGNGTWQPTSSNSWAIGSNNSIWNTNPGGFLGVGTGNPTSNLDVYSPSSASPIGAMSINVQSFTNMTNAANSYYFRVKDLTANNIPFLIRGDGKVGINTICLPSDAALAVNGKIYATALNIKLTSGGCFPDYVFDTDYKLMALSEVEKYVKVNKHLPEVPSADEVEKSGIDVAEMNILLLRKVEELTLHMIEMQKEIEKLKTK